MKKNEEIKNKRLTRENIKKIRIENLDKLEDVSLELQNSFKEIIYRQKEKHYFQIGFNRCATQSLYQAFIDCGLKAIHHNFKTTKLCFREYLATLLLDHLDKPKFLKKPLLEHKLKTYDGFFDMTYIYDDYEFNFYTYFRNIERQYPGSIFIFNTRDCLSWILSRMKLGLSTKKYQLYYKNLNEKKLKEWIDHYFEHSYLVRDYFLHKPIVKKRTKLYVYIIDKMSLSEFCKKIELPNYERIKDEKVDFIKNKKLTNDEKKHITPEIIKYIQEKKNKYGDPSNYDWWK